MTYVTCSAVSEMVLHRSLMHVDRCMTPIRPKRPWATSATMFATTIPSAPGAWQNSFWGEIMTPHRWMLLGSFKSYNQSVDNERF